MFWFSVIVLLLIILFLALWIVNAEDKEHEVGLIVAYSLALTMLILYISDKAVMLNSKVLKEYITRPNNFEMTITYEMYNDTLIPKDTIIQYKPKKK